MTVQNEIVNMEDEVRSFPDKREEYRMHRVDLYDAQMKQLEIAPTHYIMIHIAGDYNVAIQLCRSYCSHTPLCVTVTPTKYVYSGGMEEGVTVRLINYPRFPTTQPVLLLKAKELMYELMFGLFQNSATIECRLYILVFEKRRIDHGS